MSSSDPVLLDTKLAYQLEGMGLVRLCGLKVLPQCELYRQFFYACFENSPD